ncbi:helix-turn-helix domain-containing protein, partial [Planctomycetota bacterium]
DLAKRTGLKPAAISHLETGQQKPSFDTLVKLADALGVSMDYLFGREASNANTSTASSKLLKDFERLSPHDQDVVQELVGVILRKNST